MTFSSWLLESFGKIGGLHQLACWLLLSRVCEKCPDIFLNHQKGIYLSTQKIINISTEQFHSMTLHIAHKSRTFFECKNSPKNLCDMIFEKLISTQQPSKQTKNVLVECYLNTAREMLLKWMGRKMGGQNNKNLMEIFRGHGSQFQIQWWLGKFAVKKQSVGMKMGFFGSIDESIVHEKKNSNKYK